MKNYYYTILLIFLFFSQNIVTQCLNTVSNNNNEGGYFDSEWNYGNNNESTYWHTSNSDQQSTFTRDTEDFYYGSGSLKVVVDQADDFYSDAVRMWTRSSNNCQFEINNDNWECFFLH